MEYEKHIKRLVLGYLKNECKHAYKIFLKYGFQSQHKHIPTRVAGQTLEDILKVYSRIQEIVQGHLEETDYYKETNVAFSAPNHLDDQLLYLLDHGAPSVSSTPCPRSPGESSIAETHQHNEVHRNNLSDVETTPEHTLPGNISLPNTSYPRRKSEGTSFTNTSVEKLPSTNRDAASEVLTLRIPDKTDSYNKIGTNINTPECISFPQRGDNDKNKGVGEELDYMLQDFLSTPMTNTIGKVVGTESVASTSSSYTTHDSAISKSLERIDEQNNKAITSILTTANVPVVGKRQTSTTDNNVVVNNEWSQQSFNTQSTSTQQQMFTPTYAGTAQCLMQSGGGPRYLLPQSANQQYYIVNQPVVIPQSNQVMQLLQPVTPHKSLGNRNNALAKDNVQMTEQEIMAMPTIILNERNEITYADPGGLPCNTPFKLNEAHNIKEYLNLYGAYDRSPIVKIKPPKIVDAKKAETLKPVKPTPTIKVEIYQRNTTLNTETLETNAPNVGKSQDAPKKRSTTCLPNLNDTITETSDKELVVEVVKDVGCEAALESVALATNQSNEKIVDGACTPSPFKSTVRKPTPKSGSHVRNLTFPSPIRKTSEKPEERRNSPRIKNKQQAAKDLFGEEIEKEIEPKKVVSPKKKSKAVTKKSPVKKETPKSCKKGKGSKKATRKEIREARLKEVEEELNSKDSWDSNLRKLIVPPVEEKDTTPVRRTSNRKRTRASTDLDVTDPDGKKLEESLKTPENVAKKRKTPNRKKAVKSSNTLKSDTNNSKPEDENTASETKVLSPSKLNANKRNIMANDVDDVTPNNFKDTTQYPVTSKTRRNINNLLETPLKEDLVPPTPGTNPNTTETPFTPMLRANLKDFTEGDTFSIDTPNFPVTPGLAALVNTSAAYYILSENESNKVTEATVLQEEKKSSERKSDMEEVEELSPRVYGSRDILQNFNKCLVGKKNLELLDKDGVTWDGSSDKEERSDEASENVSDDESNNTVIQKGKGDQSQDGKGSLRRSRIPGKCMAVLESHLLPNSKKRMDPDDSMDICEKEPTPGITPSLEAEQNAEQDEKQSTKEGPRKNKTITQSSSSDSEILSKKVYEKRSSEMEKTRAASSGVTLETHSETEIGVIKKLDETISETDRIHSTGEDKCSNSTEDDIRRTISSVCLESNPGFRASGYSLKEQLEEKKRKFIEMDKAQAQTPSAAVRKNSARRSSMKPQPKISPRRRQRKPSSPKRVDPCDESKSCQAEEEECEENEAIVKNVKKNTRYQKQRAKNEGATELIGVDSQDEFFKQSGTNLHRKNKEGLSATEKDSEQKEDAGENVSKGVSTRRSVRAQSETKPKILEDVEEEEDESECLKEIEVEVVEASCENVPTQTEPGRDVSTQSDDDADEFNQTWDTWDFREFESEDIHVHHRDESDEPNKEPKVYDLSRLNKRIQTSMSCSDGMEATVILSVCPFQSLLDMAPMEECEHTDGSSRDEPDGLVNKSKVVKDAASDSENAESKADDVDEFKCPKKRKHRPDSTGSNSSNKRNKLLENCLNANNIGKLLDQLHGPS